MRISLIDSLGSSKFDKNDEHKSVEKNNCTRELKIKVPVKSFSFFCFASVISINVIMEEKTLRQMNKEGY